MTVYLNLIESSKYQYGLHYGRGRCYSLELGEHWTGQARPRRWLRVSRSARNGQFSLKLSSPLPAGVCFNCSTWLQTLRNQQWFWATPLLGLRCWAVTTEEAQSPEFPRLHCSMGLTGGTRTVFGVAQKKYLFILTIMNSFECLSENTYNKTPQHMIWLLLLRMNSFFFLNKVW